MKKEEVVNKIWDESTNGQTANREYMEMLVADYAKAKCKEQRELCWRNTYKHLDLHLNKSHGVMEDSESMIRNAPEPNFD